MSKASEPEEDLEPRMPAPKFPSYDDCGNIIPKELLPLPPVPNGYDRWAYKGLGYKTEENVLCATRWHTLRTWDVWVEVAQASGVKKLHYLEAIKDPC